MKLHFSKKLIVSIGILLLVLFIVYFQFFYLVPLKNDLTQKQQSLSSEQKVLNTISRNASAKAASSVTMENTTDLQQKVPVKPMQDQFILDLEKAETISNSTIKSMSFSQDNDTATNTQNTNQSSNSSGTTGQTATNQGTANQQSSNVLPSSIKKLTVQLSVESPSYDQFETFISTLESLKRIVVVEAINYTGDLEITNLNQTIQPFSFNLTVSAYYMPNLEELQAQLPKVNAPAPAGKDNPLAQFPTVMSN
ncbi:pilus assembly protein PilO [Bacillus sp. BRMEA1]|uniref:pilus assembly protein PilO n=1 Tax=Neobacillus endophyticus TaxID=2738405 RepID=UPI00156679B7|nr:pilus assembly protein PilO [Neobacillus endophyticus]NRD75997.1 pilus assembly protein PilO [Neobacillus endophyticus]